MTTWRVAFSLGVLLNEVDRQAPGRSKISDGSIGDAAHASRDSDHNPWRQVGGMGVVGARDFTHDPDAGLDCNRLAALLAVRLGKHPALGSGAYIIWNRKIISTDRLAEGWRFYPGANPHNKHLHLSVATHVGGFDSRQPWGIFGSLGPPAVPTRGPRIDAALDQLEDVPAGRGRRGQRVRRAIRVLKRIKPRLKRR